MAKIIMAVLFTMTIIPFSLDKKESREMIAILDTGLNMRKIDINYLCYGQVINFTDEDSADHLDHGTDVFNSAANYINPTTSCILSLKTVSRNSEQSVYYYLEALRYLSRKRISALVIPLEDVGYFYEEEEILKRLSQKTKIYASAGNQGIEVSQESCPVFPACFSVRFNNKNFKMVSSPHGGVNYGNAVNIWENDLYKGRIGTSFAAAIAAAKGK